MIKKIISKAKQVLDTIKFNYDANRLCKSCDYKMDKLVDIFTGSGRVLRVSRTQNSFILHTANRGVIEIVGYNNEVEQICINPQNEVS